VFEYDINGEIYSGMMYQVDQKSYMVALTNSPLEGTRLRCSSACEIGLCELLIFKIVILLEGNHRSPPFKSDDLRKK